MRDASKPFDFSQFVPGFEFLKSLSGATAPGASGFANWVAPTLSVEEIDKRIQELKTVQFWLEQNAHALKATIQALEVQKMTLSTLRDMNVRMEDLAGAFTRRAAAMRTPAAEAVAEPEPEKVEETPRPREADAPSGSAGTVDPLQWWGALTQQFQQIAASALQEASQIKMPDGAADAGGRKSASAKGRGGAKAGGTGGKRRAG